MQDVAVFFVLYVSYGHGRWSAYEVSEKNPKKVHQQFLVDAHTASLPSKTITLWINCKIGGQNYLFRCLKNRLYYQMVKMLFLFLRYWHHVTQTPVLIGFHLEMKLILHETS